MKYSIDEYAHQSQMNKWNSTLKMFFSIAIIIISISSSNFIVPLFIAVFMCVITVLIGKIKFNVYLRFLMIPAVFLVLGGFAIMAEISVDGGLYFGLENILRAVNVTSKAVGAVSAMIMLSLSTPISEVITVLGKLKVPPPLTDLMHLMYRYIFIIFDCNIKMKNAATARMGYKNYGTSIKTFGLIAGNLFIVSLHRANEYYNAIESRCASPQMKFWTKKKPVKIKHFLFFFGFTIIFILVEVIIRVNAN